MKIALLLLLSLAACGAQRIDPTFKEYYATFVAAAEKNKLNLTDRLSELSIQFGDMKNANLPYEVIAYCALRRYNAHTVGFIYVDAAWWAKLAEDSREWVILHEMGHCVLRRKHLETMQKWAYEGTAVDIPASIMHPRVFGGEGYRINRDIFLKELFSTEGGL